MTVLKKILLYTIWNLGIIGAIPVVIMTIDKTDIVDEKSEDLKSLLRSDESFYIHGECVSRRIFYDDIGKSWIENTGNHGQLTFQISHHCVFVKQVQCVAKIVT